MTPAASPNREDVPFVVRLAGIPAETMERFHHDLCAAYLQPMDELSQELGRAREQLAGAIHAVVTGASPELRRFLLAVKRDCFNARSLRRRVAAEAWPGLRELTGPFADQVIELEDAWERSLVAFRAAYEQAREDEIRALAEVCEHPGLARGLALASPALMENRHRHGRGESAKKEADLEASLLRYLSRAALKTSPFSAFTRVGLGTAVAGLDQATLELVAAPLSERSLLRFKRYLPEQDYAMLVRHPRVRAGLRVVLNSSLWAVSAGHYCFLRPGFWRAKEGRMGYQQPALVELDLGGPLVSWLLETLPRRQLAHAELVDELGRTFGQTPETLRATLDKLIDIGFLRLLPPWVSNTEHLERCMLDHLRTLDRDPELAAMLQDLERIVTVEEGYAQAGAPLTSVHRLLRDIDVLWEQSRRLGHIEPTVQRFHGPTGGLYEDVLVVAERGPWREVVRIDRGAVDAMVMSGRPLTRFAKLYHPQHEFLHTAAAFAARRWPGRRLVGAIELVREIQPLWRTYTKFLAGWRRAPAIARREMVFNPLQIESLEELRQIRGAVWTELEQAVVAGPEESSLSADAMEAILDRVPARYLPSVGACLMVQPAEGNGQRWVINRMLEGTGRYSSRYIHLLPDEVRRRYTDHLAERSSTEHGGQFLDLMFSSGDTLNIHPVQTAKVLELPDEWLDLPPERTMSLADLSVCFDSPDALPEVVDPAGNAFAPVHLGVADESFMPTVLRVLGAFGPGELAPLGLPRRARRCRDMHIVPPQAVGKLISNSQRRVIPAHAVPRQEIAGVSRDQAFMRVNDWRLALALPERVFLIERLHQDTRGDLYKPQYIDFTSPGFVALFARILARGENVLHLEEVLPGPEIAPPDRHGRRWVVELQIDTLALRPRTRDK
jgi:hypothetical protein